MKHLYLNLKRFDVPVEYGGVNRLAPVDRWAEQIVKGTQEGVRPYAEAAEFVMFFPELHLLYAKNALIPGSPIKVGCQSIYRQDTAVGGNFGAFTANRSASSMKAAGVEQVLIGHCEERNDKAGILMEAGVNDPDAVNRLLNQEVLRAQERGLKVLYCIGEKEEELPDKEVFLKSLKMKAGMPADYFSPTFEAYRFETEYIEEK